METSINGEKTPLVLGMRTDYQSIGVPTGFSKVIPLESVWIQGEN